MNEWPYVRITMALKQDLSLYSSWRMNWWRVSWLQDTLSGGKMKAPPFLFSQALQSVVNNVLHAKYIEQSI